MDMKKILGIVSGETTQKLNESVEECGHPIPMMQPSPIPHVRPVTMNVSVNAQGIDQIKDLLNLMTGAQSQPQMIVSQPTVLDEPKDEIEIGTDTDPDVDEPQIFDKDDDNEITTIKNLAGIEVEPRAKTSDSKKAEMAAVLSAAMKSKSEKKTDETQNELEDQYDASTTPNPSYQDIDYMTKDLAGGLNKQKKMFKHSYKQGDNPMAMEEFEMLKNKLFNEYSSYKLNESSKVNETYDYDEDLDYQEAMEKVRFNPTANNDEFTDPIVVSKKTEIKEKHKQTWQRDKEGIAPNKKPYNCIAIIDAVNKYSLDAEINSLEDYHKGAKDVVDVQEVDSVDDEYPVRAILYVVDNHKYGTWKPWKTKRSMDTSLGR